MTAIETAPAPARQRWLRTGIALVAAYQLIEGLSNAWLIFADYHHDTAYLRFAQALISVKLALNPLVAAAALMFAVRGRLREAILALAAFVVIGFLLDDLWSFPLHGLELSLDVGGFVVFVHHFVFPAAAIAGGTLALRERRLALAGLLVCFPTLFDLAGILTFTAAIMIYGF